MAGYRSNSPLVVLCIVWLAAPAAGQSIRHVDDDASAGGDGLTWETAYNDLQDALAEAGTDGLIAEIRVAEGTYRPDCMPHPCFGDIGDREASFELLNGVAIMGGYRGCPGGDCSGDPDERNLELYETILSGDLNANDGPDPFEDYDENSLHVVTASDIEDTATLDGFTITAGMAASGDYDGGGCLATASSLRIVDCTFSENYAAFLGGGWAIHGGTSTVENCLFRGNVSGILGGALFSEANEAVFTNCTFDENTAGEDGGAVLNAISMTLNACLFSGNTAVNGGGVYGAAGGARVFDCTFIGNMATGNGGGLVSDQGCDFLQNCRFLGNMADGQGGGVYHFAYQIGGVLQSNNLFSGNWAGAGGGGMGIYCGFIPYTQPLVNCTFSGNTTDGSGGGIYASHSKPSLSSCILWGNADAGGSFEYCEFDYTESSEPSAVYSCIQGWTGELGGEGNIGDDPLFVDPAGPDGVVGTTDDNFRLQPGSPCIDAGDNTGVLWDAGDLDGDGDIGERTPVDLDLGPRFLDDPTTPDTGVADPPDYPHVVDMGAYEYLSPVLSAVSLLDHGRTELGLDILANNVEPRADGVLKIEVQTSSEVADVTADVACVNSVYTGTVTATPAGNTVTLDFSEALPDVDCCEITLTGDLDECFTVRPLAGDTDRNGVVSTADVSVIKPHFGETADSDNAEFDFDCDGLIATADFSQIKPLFGNTAPECP